MQNHETDRHGNRNGIHDGNLFNSFQCDKKLASQNEEHQPDPSTKWNPVEIFRENFMDKFFDSRPSFVGENFETNFEERLKSRSKPESFDLETSPEPLNHSGHDDDYGDGEFEFFKSLSEDELRCFTEVVIGVAKEEESKMRKANAKLLRELLYFRGEVIRAVRENNCRFDSRNDLLPNDFMFDDNIETYEALLQKRQPVLYQHIVGATQPEQLCHVMQDIRGVMDNLDMARSLVTLNFLDSNCSTKDPSEADQKKFEGRDGTESKFQFVGDETIKRPKYVSVFSPQKIEEVRERTNVASPVDEVFARFNNLGLRVSSESWVTVDTVDLNSENDKIDSIPDYEMSRGSWTPDFKNEPTLNTEMKPNNDKEVELSSDKKHHETDRTNRAATKCGENSTDEEYGILKSLVRELFQRFLRSSYFTNPGFVESVDDAIDFDLQPNIALNQQGYKNIDTDASSKTVQFRDLSLTVKPDLFDFSFSHSPSCRSIIQREPEQRRPMRALQPIRQQQMSIPHYSSIWLTSIARLSLENFLRTSSIPVVQASSKMSNLPHKLKIKPKNTGSQTATHTKLPQTSHVETITSIQNASRLNFFSANDSTAVSKSTVTSNPSRQSRGCDQLVKYCNKPCKFILVKQITNFQNTTDASDQFFSSTPSLKWIVKWLKKPLRVHQAVLPARPIKPDPLEISLQDQSKKDAIKANKNNMQFTMVEVEIRDLTQSDQSDANAAAVVDKTPAITSTTTTNVKPNVIIKTLNPSDIFTTPLTQTSNVITTPSTSHHNTHHPSRIGKIPMKQQRRRHIYRNI